MRLDDFFNRSCDALDYDALYQAFDWVRAMAATPQEPRFHGEGDVWTHTRMVCDAMARDPDWPALPTPERRTLLTAGLLHDAGKPEVTFTDDAGRIRSPDHARRGEVIARRLLWQLEEPYEFREQVATLVRQHMQPRYLPEQRDPRRRAFAVSQTIRCDHLALLARADTRGRIARDYDHALARIDGFVEFCARHRCLREPRRFASDQARFLFFQGALDDPDAEVAPPAGPNLVVMSGLPGSGKDSWLRHNARDRTVVSLDEIRAEIGVDPTAPQEPVVSLARQRAVRLLASGQDLVWNATALGKHHRAALLRMARPFDPRISIVYVEAPPSLLFPRNRARTGGAVVPDDVIWRMTGIWQPPDATEAHDLRRVLHDAGESALKAS